MICAVLLALAPATTPWPADARYFVRTDSELVTDRWRGARPDPVDRTDLRQRLQLGVFGERWRLNVDLSVGSDLGPPLSTLDAMPDGRRVRLDARAVELNFTDLGGALDLRLGRHVLYDGLGFDALDGATARARLVPHVVLEGSAGLAVRRGWSDFGPDVYEPDGAPLTEDRGSLVGAAVETRDLGVVQGRASYRRLFDDEVQRADAGLALTVGPLDAGVRYDTVFGLWSDLWAGADGELGPLRAGARWRRVTPTFSADSIWNAFGAEPYDAVDGSLGWATGPWRLRADGGARLWHADETSGDGGARLTRLLDGDGQLGAEARAGFGYGGTRHYGDAFARLPLPTQAPVFLRVRAGAVYVGDTSGWGLLALSWQPAEQVRLEAVSEAFGGPELPYRVRAMGRVVVEEWL